MPDPDPLDDNHLAALLERAGSDFSVAQLRDLACGVAGAPPGHDPTAWVELAAPGADPAVTRDLMALVDAIREAGDGPGDTPTAAARLAALRDQFADRGLDGFIIPLADEHQGEFVPPRARRLAWLTGFTGSAGTAVVLRDKAAIFVDGRYTLQVREQVDEALFEPLHVTETPPQEWIASNLDASAVLGYDPWLHTLDAVDRLRAACDKAQSRLAAVDSNPVDAAWTNQPARPISPVRAHDPRYAGADSSEKRDAVGRKLSDSDAYAAVLTAPESICWLLNIRGADVPNTPLTLCFAIVKNDGGVELFIDARKLTMTARKSLGGDVRIAAPDRLGPALDDLGKSDVKILVDPKTSPSWIFDRLKLSGASIIEGDDPCALPKSCKNATELAGARAAHIRDGAALCRFLCWLAGEAPKGTIDEISAAERLNEYRARDDLFQGLSFDTISGAGPNGAIVHYHAAPQTSRRLEPGMVYLVDSGGQYLDGTTDVTRTVFIPGPPDGGAAAPPSDARDRFTRVLKGHIALAQAYFPAGTSGGQLDTLARAPLWRVGCDYDHGTGHGVGSFLGVHEGPARIGKQGASVALRAGMIMSNEPGYYKVGEYGIRIENLVIVTPAEAAPGGRDMLEFETITLAPIDRALIDPSLMTPDEIAWLDAYHGRVRESLTPLVDAATAQWLAEVTAPLA